MLNRIFKSTLLIVCAYSFAFAENAILTESKTAPSQDPEAEKIFREDVKGMENGWNNKNGEEFAQSFADNAYFVYNAEGRYIDGKKAIGESLHRALNSIYKNSVIEFKVNKIHFLRPDVAIVNIGLLSRVKEKPEIAVKGQMVWVMSKNDGKWEIETLFYEFDKRWLDLMKELREGTYKAPENYNVPPVSATH